MLADAGAGAVVEVDEGAGWVHENPLEVGGWRASACGLPSVLPEPGKLDFAGPDEATAFALAAAAAGPEGPAAAAAAPSAFTGLPFSSTSSSIRAESGNSCSSKNRIRRSWTISAFWERSITA